MKIPISTALILCLTTVYSQNNQTDSNNLCSPDVQVDDFSIIRSDVVNGKTSIVNLLGGDYGSDHVTFDVDSFAKDMLLSPTLSNVTADGMTNHWFVKFDSAGCTDFSNYTAISFNLNAPSGSTFNITLTQRSSNCSVRLTDSVHVPISKYIRPSGQDQRVILPLSDFRLNLNNQEFDFSYLRDMTFMNLDPVNATFIISDLKLLSGPQGCNRPTVTTTVSALGPSSTPTGKASSSSSNSGLSLNVSVWSVILLIFYLF